MSLLQSIADLIYFFSIVVSDFYSFILFDGRKRGVWKGGGVVVGAGVEGLDGLVNFWVSREIGVET